MVSWGLGLLAEAETLAGRHDEALRLLDDALGRVARTGERLGEAELYRLKGVALLAGDPARPAAARVAFDEAVTVARRQGSTLLEHRAAEDPRPSPTAPTRARPGPEMRLRTRRATSSARCRSPGSTATTRWAPSARRVSATSRSSRSPITEDGAGRHRPGAQLHHP